MIPTLSTNTSASVHIGEKGNITRAVGEEQIVLGFHVKSFGAKGNGIAGNKASIADGSTALTDPDAAFTPADIGKSIQVVGAGVSGAPLNTTIAACVDTSHVTLASAANTAVTSATYAYGTDDTLAIQSAINAAEVHGGGTVYFDYGMYIIAGSSMAQSARDGHSTLRQSVQISLPRRDYFKSQTVTLKLMGPIAPSQVPSVIGAAPVPQGGAVLRSFATSGAVIGGLPPSEATYYFSAVCVWLENLTVRLYDNPQASGIDLSYMAACRLNNVNVDTGIAYIEAETLATNSASYGILTPRNNNGAYTQIDNALVQGYYYGYEINEHTNAASLGAWGCRYAASVANAYHAMRIARFEVVHCPHGIRYTGPNPHDRTPSARLSIEQLDIEKTAAARFAQVTDIDDPLNYAHGNITWAVVTANVGVTHDFILSGAANLRAREIGTGP